AADGIPLVKISALTGEGMEDLCQAIEDAVVAGEGDLGTSQVVPNLRHQNALNDAVIFFNKATANTREELPVEIIAVDLQSGLDALGEITGANATDEVLERIFSEFCLGK
ncbi:MAG: tRNA uridine-5-carboxymethylaminomethyl(34) synthesis GTPase MnmE, partial [Deltaproteobacteria bacterium]|nr:tRNA uridine-5-carboxymethylaminomethyl(34) synthesis GTPase MnmE [Deltaproteobacteria bacterium]